MKRILLCKIFILLIINVLSCQKKQEDQVFSTEKIALSYAQGFEIEKGDGFWILTVTQPWTSAEENFTYLVLEENQTPPEGEFDGIIQLPIQHIVLTSTTQIPHLDLLGQTSKLRAFPNLDLISSPRVWERIEQGEVQDLGSAPSANIELILDLNPDWVMISTLGEDLKSLQLLKNAGISAPINGEYVEQHPLGRAEWIKFTGVLLGDYQKSLEVFEAIEKDYLEALELVKEIETTKPTVLSGVLYQDIWYAPGADSWGAKILQNAGGEYIFGDKSGTGSLQLNYEFVLDQALNSDFWIGSADFSNLEEMGSNEPRYRSFAAFQKGNVFTYTAKKGPKGGLEYFELGYMRPDWVLKDIIKILHPELLPDYELYFYTRLDEK
ncbi:ABC transporter substrate-binding protein [Algoriphagus sp. NBT04N3]|uniref:ABC transporter substrate-binding protein n=1 Tax=Algoriphagus sp. NBT04N3 TaxID=2705473 RepID=UPI0021052D9B|nr:ABC transporter substrate-binding protein [Algoriphagus sp. NBT04N3]